MLNLDEQYKPERKKLGFLTRLRGNFLTGLVIVLPVALTIWMVWSFVGFVDNRVLPLVPSYYKSKNNKDISFIFTSPNGSAIRAFYLSIAVNFSRVI